MEAKEILEGNKLIDDFAPEVAKEMKWNKPTHISEREGLKFNTSWDWLMPAWKKLAHEVYEFRDNLNAEDYKTGHEFTRQMLRAFQKTDIEDAWQTLVEFITWHNSQTELTLNNAEKREG